jgi:hypothetical protein
MQGLERVFRCVRARLARATSNLGLVSPRTYVDVLGRKREAGRPGTQIPLPDFRPWGRRPLTIPPTSVSGLIQLVVWELWMGMLVCIVAGLGIGLIVTSPDRIVKVTDLNGCYAAPPVALPCERILYRGGALDAAFTALCGVMLVGVALWLLWELWSAAEPRPITDDFLKLLNESFGRDWRNPLKWPWARVLWAYGFTVVGVMMTAVLATGIWTFVTSSKQARAPTVKIETSQRFSVGSAP